MQIGVAWVIGGVVVVGGILIYMHVQNQNNLVAGQNALNGLGAGVDQSRQDVVQGLKLGQSIADFGKAIAEAAGKAAVPQQQMTPGQPQQQSGSLRSSSLPPQKAPVKK